MTDIAEINGILIEDVVKYCGLSIDDITEINGYTIPSGGAGYVATVFNSGATVHMDCCAVGTTKIFITYYDDANADKATGVVCDISSGSIVVGSEVVWSADDVYFQNCCALTDSLVVATGDDKLNGNKIAVNAFSISGTTLTSGTKTIVSAAVARYPVIRRLTDTTALLVYRDGVNGYVFGQVISFSGTTITAGTETTIHSSSVNAIGGCVGMCVLTSTKAIVICSNKSYLITISGTTLSASSPYTIKKTSGYDIDDQPEHIIMRRLSDTRALVAITRLKGWEGDATDYGVGVFTLDISGSTTTNGSYVGWGTEQYPTCYGGVSVQSETSAKLYVGYGVTESSLTEYPITITSTTTTIGTGTIVESVIPAYCAAKTLTSTLGIVAWRGTSNYGYVRVFDYS